MFTIIEDASPYYIRFTHSGIDRLIRYCQQRLSYGAQFEGSYGHSPLRPFAANAIINMCPASTVLPFDTADSNAVKFFIANPGSYYRAHKDGIVNRFNINYGIDIKDEMCVTSWYKEEDLAHYAIDNLANFSSRECADFNSKIHVPAKSIVARQGEGILFNTDIFHSWDNSKSPNTRVILTLKIAQHAKSSTYFEDARMAMFGY